MAATFGQTTAPLVITTYLDSVFAQSLANYRKKLIDNIGATNALLYEIMKSDSYESAAGGTYFAEILMYALAPSDSYDGYDDLSTMPTDGITQAEYEWRQVATPISYNMKEVKQNEQRLLSLVSSKIQQAEMGIQEGWAEAFMWGAAPSGGALTSPRVSLANNSLHVNPLPMLVSYNTAGSNVLPAGGAAGGSNLTVGGLPEGTYDWWRNIWGTSAATTYSGFLLEMETMYNTCALGTGGPPTLILTDQVTYQLFVHAYFSIYKTAPEAPNQEYPFVAKKFFNAKIVMDDKVPDVYTGTAPTMTGGRVLPNSLTYGTMYFINTKFFKIRYASDRDFEMLKDENGKTFAKPINGDSRVGHLAWMGNTTLNNRRKHGVLGKIARTLS